MPPAVPQTKAGKPFNVRALLAVGVPVALGWLWSMGLLVQRVHSVDRYYVSSAISDLAGWLGSLLIALHPTLFWMTFVAMGVGWVAARAFRPAWPVWARAVVLAGFWAVPVLDLVRLAWPSLPVTFLEPIGLALLTGWAVRDFVRLRPSRSSSTVLARPRAPGWLWFLAVAVVAAALGEWWFWVSHRAYADYELGYFDFGHFARRVINTWRGYGFLQQTPGLPPFWDHFNPGLAGLAPLWGLWPDAHLFFALQAMCLALPAVFVYGIARRLGAAPVAAAAWAGAYLTWPVVGQLNYNFSYGWHPVSTALPLMLAAAYCLLSRRKVAALALAVVACSFKEDVLVVTGGLAAGLAILAWRERRRTDLSAASAFAWLPAPWVSAAVAGGLLVVTATVFGTMDFPRYQVARFSALGGNIWSVAMSPLLRPGAFWGAVFSAGSLYYLLILFMPFGAASAVRGWPIQIALAIPLGLLLAWHVPNAKSIAFQYATCLIVVITWAALIGVRRSPAGRSDPARTMAVEGAAALATALCMSLVFGVLPSSPPTTPFHVGQDRRAEWTAHCRRLDRLVAMIHRPDTSVVASGRVAAHLLGVRRLEPVSDALDRHDLLAREAGPGKTWLDVFEWVLLDRRDMLQLGKETVDTVAAEFVRAGFEIRYNEDDILLLHRPTPR